MGISILLGKEGRAHQHHKLVVDQGLRLPTGHQQNLQHHQGEPKVELHRLIGPLRHHLAGHLHHQDHHHPVHQIGHLHHRDHPHHHALRAQAVRAEVAEVVEDDKFFLYL